MTVWRILALCLVLTVAGTTAVQAQTPPEFTFQDALAALAGGDFEVPPEWAGIWDITNETFNCGSSTPLSSETELDTLCTGSLAFQPEDEDLEPGVEFDCTGQITSTTVSIDCVASFPIDETCTGMFTIETDAIRNGDSYSSISTITTTYEGTGMTCEFLPDQCFRSETTGSKIAGEPGTCFTPVESTRWGTLKALYE